MTAPAPATPAAVCPQCGPTTLHRHLDWPRVLACAGCGRLDSAAGWERRERREA